MAETYTTKLGDTWDSIAYDLYGAESYMKDLIEANWDYIDTLIFGAGTVLDVPEVEDELDTDAPFWSTDDSDDETYSQTEDEEDE